ncbi:uncharacterized protein LOC141691417 [Apium graveolens]|uniref:uncharacterized protein LOC141691417 n=1 Tax=Apium graveolens TaxID=4045 RepID=UPI003D7BA1D8
MKRGPAFHRLIRLYNAIFAFISTGGNIDHSINNGRVPYVYRLNGQNHHVFGSLILNDNETTKFCQLYIYDTINKVDNRLWQQRDLYENDEIVDLQITLKVIRSESRRECHICSTDEVVGIMVGDTEETCGDRDIVVNEKSKGLVRVSYIHPKLMALHNICRSVSRGDVDTSNTGKVIVLPAGYKMMEYVPGCIAPNCPDIISRVFRLKLEQLMGDIKDKKHFGVCIGVMYVVEFQKRGLPYNVDKFVSAEIPDPLLDTVGYAAVKEFMIHVPCGNVLEQLLMTVASQCICDAGDKNYTFRANEALGKVASREKNKFSKLETFFNSVDVNARKYPYDEIPRFYVWNDSERRWSMRKCGFQIGRLCYAHHSTGEPWFLRLLLTKFYALGEIDELLRSVGKSLKKFDQLPQPPRSYLNNGTNNLIIEETSYDTGKIEYENVKLLQDCTEEQRNIYDDTIY